MIKEENGRYIVSLKIKSIPVIVSDYTTQKQAIQAEKIALKNKKFFINLKQFRFLVAHNIKSYKPTQQSDDGLYRPRLYLYSKLLGKRSVVLGKHRTQEESRQAVYDYLYRGRIPKTTKKVELKPLETEKKEKPKDILDNADTINKRVDNSLIFKLMEFLNNMFFFMR
jgi:hypothetical protein